MKFSQLLPGYYLHQGSQKDRSLLVKFMQLTYREILEYTELYSHLALTVERYFTSETPLWFVFPEQSTEKNKVACLWMGNGIDQVSGERYYHIFLLYVCPEYRHLGIASALLNKAQDLAIARGDSQIGLSVFKNNQAALNLYQSFGFQTQSLLMLKSLDN